MEGGGSSGDTLAYAARVARRTPSHQRRGGITVEGTAPLLQQLRFGLERGITVQLQQPRLDLQGRGSGPCAF